MSKTQFLIFPIILLHLQPSPTRLLITPSFPLLRPKHLAVIRDASLLFTFHIRQDILLTLPPKCTQNPTNPLHFCGYHLAQASTSRLDFCRCLLTSLRTAASVPLLYQPLCSKPSSGPHLTCSNPDPPGFLSSGSHYCLAFLPPPLLCA